MEINSENREKIIALLEEGICPICNKGRFKNPLQHVRQAHGINSKELKDIILVSRKKAFTAPETSEKMRLIAIEENRVEIMLKNRTKVHKGLTELGNEIVDLFDKKYNYFPV